MKPKKPQTFRLWLPDGPITRLKDRMRCPYNAGYCPSNTDAEAFCPVEYVGDCPILPLEV